MIFYKTLQISYASPHDLQDTIQINYRLRNSNITYKWVERVLAAQNQGYKIDDPGRFYGFGSVDSQKIKAITDINNLVEKLNYWLTIDIKIKSVDEQDKLNQLHSVFETEHGLLDQKNSDPELKNDLCNLNLLIHRCESIARGANPRHVVTYFGLPKIKTLDDDDYEYFESKIIFGTVYINYAEIGKTLTDLMLDNDNYIQPAAFQPFYHYSADFVVKFWEDQNSTLEQNLYYYYLKNQNYFRNLGYDWHQLSKSIGSIPVADLDYEGDILKILETRQFVKAVHFF